MERTKWVLDPTHSELGFKIRHLMISNVSGVFKSFTVEMETESTDWRTGEINVTVDMTSISTNNHQRDAHLQNSDFFEVEKYPDMKFTSSKVEKVDSNTYVLHGDLLMKGVTKPINLNVEFNGMTKDPWGNEKAGFLVTGKINRSDWGVNFNAALETGGVVLGEDVRINSEIQLIKQSAIEKAAKIVEREMAG